MRYNKEKEPIRPALQGNSLPTAGGSSALAAASGIQRQRSTHHARLLAELEGLPSPPANGFTVLGGNSGSSKSIFGSPPQAAHTSGKIKTAGTYNEMELRELQKLISPPQTDPSSTQSYAENSNLADSASSTETARAVPNSLTVNGAVSTVLAVTPTTKSVNPEGSDQPAETFIPTSRAAPSETTASNFDPIPAEPISEPTRLIPPKLSSGSIYPSESQVLDPEPPLPSLAASGIAREGYERFDHMYPCPQPTSALLDTGTDSDNIMSVATSGLGNEADPIAQTLVLPLGPKPQQDKLEVPGSVEISNDAIELESLARVATNEVVNMGMI
ncbi:hypothetical protein MMYC01_209491 [Madurella mycetomatis]|uniref:Uncharacterized protein n=1 Tax=Madurella mycetomatis TaxID=100816 RepID=A0A175VTZ5_9PEZI|nr:hypothetical protein MMYC01_209491 [Madurella mycetomatis]